MTAVAEKTFSCPRRTESIFGRQEGPFPGPDHYDERDAGCTYCGSLDPDIFMARLEAGDVELGSTDKNYKVYVHNAGGESFKQAYRNCPHDREMTGAAGNKYMTSSCDQGPDACTHWTVRDISQAKFYFQHLSTEQRKRFIDLLNEGKIKFARGFGFYVMPFFIATSREQA